MNFLAHIYLSGDNPRIQIGNFMGDGIRGKDYKHYHPDIQIGVLLHRSIDSFTDFHPVFRQSKHRLTSKFNHFSGIIIDMFYDHFLAKNWSMYSDIPLATFTHQFYENLHVHYDELNDKTKRLIPYMTENDWLYNYQYIDYLEKILHQMDKRFSVPSNMDLSIEDLQKHYAEFEEEFTIFFAELSQFAKEKLAIFTF